MTRYRQASTGTSASAGALRKAASHNLPPPPGSACFRGLISDPRHPRATHFTPTASSPVSGTVIPSSWLLGISVTPALKTRNGHLHLHLHLPGPVLRKITVKYCESSRFP